MVHIMRQLSYWDFPADNGPADLLMVAYLMSVMMSARMRSTHDSLRTTTTYLHIQNEELRGS